MNENETVDNDGEDLATQLTELREQLASERAEKLKVDQKNRELVREKQKIAVKAEDIETVKATLAEREKELRNIRVDNELGAALSQGKVRDEMREALAALMRSKVSYDDGQASIDGKSISAFVGSYLGTKNGAHFVRAADNSGAGATGNPSTQAAGWSKPPVTSDEWNKFDRLANDDPALRNSLADKWNRPELKV